MRFLLSLAAGIVLLAGLLAAPLMAAQPRYPEFAAGIFPPWWSASQALAAAAEAGHVQRLGAFPFIVVVRRSDGDVSARLRSAGAFLTLDAFGAAACITRLV